MKGLRQPQGSVIAALNATPCCKGMYYNPKFVGFFRRPHLQRSQANSGQGSLTDASSVNGE